MPGGLVGGGSARRWIGAMAAVVLLGIGAVACSGDGDGDRDGGTSSSPDADPYRAQSDQLLNHLKGTSQGAYVTGVAIFPRDGAKSELRITIDTDFRAESPTDASADAVKKQGMKIAVEAEEWLLDHRPDGMVRGQVGVQDDRYGPIGGIQLPDYDEAQQEADRLAADLLAKLRALPEGSHVTRVAARVMDHGDLAVYITTDLEPYKVLSAGADRPVGGLEPADAGPRVQIGKALLAGAVQWTWTLFGATQVDHFSLLDREKDTAETSRPYPRSP